MFMEAVEARRNQFQPRYGQVEVPFLALSVIAGEWHSSSVMSVMNRALSFNLASL